MVGIFQELKQGEYRSINRGELKGCSDIKNPLRYSATVNIEKIYKFCFLRYILVELHLVFDSKNGLSTRISIYRQCFDE